MLITKRLNASDAWIVQHHEITTGNPWDDLYVVLNTDAGRAGTYSVSGGYAPNANEFYVGNDTSVNGSGSSYITYCFTGKQGFSQNLEATQEMEMLMVHLFIQDLNQLLLWLNELMVDLITGK